MCSSNRRTTASSGPARIMRARRHRSRYPTPRSGMAGGVEPVPEGVPTVATRLVFDDAAAAIAFYQEAFGATVSEEPYTAQDGKVVRSEVRIGESVVFMTDEGEDRNGVAPSSVGGLVTAVMALNVPDVDALWERAVAVGCEVVYPSTHRSTSFRHVRASSTSKSPNQVCTA